MSPIFISLCQPFKQDQTEVRCSDQKNMLKPSNVLIQIYLPVICSFNMLYVIYLPVICTSHRKLNAFVTRYYPHKNLKKVVLLALLS